MLPAIRAQEAADWQAKAGGKMAFDVASVKLSTEKQVVPLSVPLDAGDRYRPNGGYFRANVPLWSYIQFAYKLWVPVGDQQKEVARLPQWVTTDRYTWRGPREIERSAKASPPRATRQGLSLLILVAQLARAVRVLPQLKPEDTYVERLQVCAIYSLAIHREVPSLTAAP